MRAGVDITSPDALGPSTQIVVQRIDCLGDCDGFGEVMPDCALLAVMAFAQDDLSLNPAADGNQNGSVDADEACK